MDGIRVTCLIAMLSSVIFVGPSSASCESITVQGLVFSGVGKPGDFGWMIRQTSYHDVLFIFNDNIHQSTEYIQNFADPPADACSAGSGNAVVRPYQCLLPQRAVGIPTGPDFPRLDESVKSAIDLALMRAREIVSEYGYCKIFYNSRDENGIIGTNIFTVGDDVKAYITAGIRKLAK